MSDSPFSWGTRVLAAGALILAIFLGVGWLLPGTWEARAVTEIDAPPAAVYRYLDAPSGWQAWTPWPESATEVEGGPSRGAGAAITWDDMDIGDGTFRIVEARDGQSVTYTVDVQEGTLTTQGRVDVQATTTGSTRVVWEESGDFGWNPLMGYWALLMGRVQSREMERSLDRLEELVRDPQEG